jgi:hypothetical protein
MTQNATTDPESGLRFYRWMDRDLISVTSARRVVGMPFNLHQWTLSQVVDRAVDDAEQVIAMRDRPAASARERKTIENARAEARKWVRAAATEERDKAGDRGTAVHEAIAAGMTHHNLPWEVASRVQQWEDFLAQTGAEVVWSERQVWNLTEGYAGTADILLRLPQQQNDLILTDLKTSAGVYVDHALQVVAYGMGEFVGEDNIIDGPATDALLAANRLGILHLTDKDWMLYDIRPDADLYKMWLSQLHAAQFLLRHPNIDGLVQSVAHS